ncbi:RNA polymerase sigma-70 factor [Mangrovibacterium marinum]|uniref:RNA polymerase sigma-70 factor n=1 Tax=Mangrovibacterium marinum TaxID=1639118 RepID=UPI002A18CE4F|nr:RNA polymerase sigma-70 factor [Mangrovibacterium marinum]
MIKDEELYIFNRMVKGDKEAFRFFFEKYYSDLCNLVNLYLRDPMISEEIVQDIFIYFWEKKERIKVESSVKSYLLRATKNKSLNFIRDERNKLNIHDKLAGLSRASSEMPDKIMDANQLRDVIDSAINSLPDRCREVYILGKEKDLSYKEISEELGISIKTVEVQMGKALKKLREELRPHYNDIFIFFLFCITK